jgi:3-oxoacyl-[acyl-carrier protein] reductase
MTDGLFRGEVALVTGAASGIGRGIAKALASEGARLVLSDVNGEALDAVAAEIGAAEIGITESTPITIPVDLSGASGHEELFTAAVAAADGLSILVHSASPRRLESQNAATVTEAEWDAMVNTNLRSGFFLARAAADHMRRAAVTGRILFITSQHRFAPRNLPHYSASKAGQVMVIKELARLYGPHGIRVNGIAPGAIPGGGFAANVEQLNARIAMRRVGTPEDVSGMALALLSERFSAYVTGEVVSVDGGLALHNWIDPPILDD